MDPVRMNTGSPLGMRSGSYFYPKWDRMDGTYSAPYNQIPPVSGCSLSRQLIPGSRVWQQDYLPPEEGGTWIADEDRLEAARLFFSPYDLDAKASTKRSIHWIGDI